MRKMNRAFITISILLLITGFVAQSAFATGKGYTPGSEGVLAASVPPAGFHWRTFNIFYESDCLKDKSGNKAPLDLDLTVFAQAHRLIKITKIKFLGADYGFSAIIPIVATDFKAGASIDSNIGLGDIYIEPIILGWHGSQYDAAFGLGFNLPTGEFNASEPSSPGNDYWSSMLSLGGTWFFDTQKSLSASILTRTLIYGKQDKTDYEHAPEFIADFGIGKEIPLAKGLLIRPGICGYGFWQLGEDDGPNPYETGTVYALGAEVNLFWLPPSLFQINLRSLAEFGAEDETEGIKTVLTVTKSF